MKCFFWFELQYSETDSHGNVERYKTVVKDCSILPFVGEKIQQLYFDGDLHEVLGVQRRFELDDEDELFDVTCKWIGNENSSDNLEELFVVQNFMKYICL